MSTIYKELIHLNIRKQITQLKMGRGPEQTFSKEDIQTQKRCTTLQIIRKMQIKTTRRCHLTLIRMIIIKNTTDNKCWHGHREKGTLVNYWWKCKLVQTQWKTAWQVLKRLNIELPYKLAIYTQRKQNHSLERVSAPLCSLQHYPQ